MVLKSGEAKYYLKFCIKHPHIWGKLVSYALARIELKIRDRVYAVLGINNRFHHYPREIRNKAKKISSPFCLRKDWLNHLPSTGWSPGNSPNLESCTIPMATYSIAHGELSWYKYEQDQEDTFALHRFIWLLRWLSLRPVRDDLNTTDLIILSWIEQVTPAKNLSAWKTYSVSERVVNWLLYLCATKSHRSLDSKSTQIIGTALLEHLRHIVENLEYYGEFYNNHILNNARALYIGGRFMHLPQVALVGKNLFQQFIPRLVDEEGSLLEGSSHYQLLLTRTLLEVLWAAQVSGDLDFAKWLEDITSSMISCCLYLGGTSSEKIDDTFPRIGDISPDYPVAWFYPYPEYRQESESWWGLWDATAMSSLIKKIRQNNLPASTLKEWKWIVDPHDVFSVLIHTPQNPNFYPPAHGHLDFGSFLLYDAKGPVLIDRGRMSYNSDNLGVYGFSARAHNTTLINGLAIMPDCRGIFLGYKKYQADGTKINLYKEGLEKKISWQADAVERLGKDIKWQRDVIINQERVTSLETVSNPMGNSLTIESYIHWAPGWTMSPDCHQADSDYCFVIMKNGRGYHLKIETLTKSTCKIEWFKGSSNSPDGWHFPKYGVRTPALTLRLSLQTAQNYILRFTLCPV